MKDGLYMFETEPQKQIWLIQNNCRKVIKTLYDYIFVAASGTFLIPYDFNSYNEFIPIDINLYKFLRPLTDEEKLELL